MQQNKVLISVETAYYSRTLCILMLFFMSFTIKQTGKKALVSY